MQEFVQRFDGPAYAVRDEPDLPIAGWNIAAQQELGWTAEEAVGRPVYDVVRPQLTPRRVAVKRLWEVGWWSGPTVLLDRHGVPHEFVGTCCRVWSPSGELYYLTVLSVATDVVLQIAESLRKEVIRNTPHVARKPWQAVPHVAQRATGLDGDLVASSRPMTEDEVEENRLAGANLQLAREARQATQQQLALRLGYSGEQAHSIISRWEVGKVRLKVNRLKQLAVVLGLPSHNWFRQPQTEVPAPPDGWTWGGNGE